MPDAIVTFSTNCQKVVLFENGSPLGAPFQFMDVDACLAVVETYLIMSGKYRTCLAVGPLTEKSGNQLSAFNVFCRLFLATRTKRAGAL
jgi:hypothetical protein